MSNIFHRHKILSGFGPKYERAVRNYLLQKSLVMIIYVLLIYVVVVLKVDALKMYFIFGLLTENKVCLVLICPMSLICEENITDVRRLGKKVEHF